MLKRIQSQMRKMNEEDESEGKKPPVAHAGDQRVSSRQNAGRCDGLNGVTAVVGGMCQTVISRKYVLSNLDQLAIDAMIWWDLFGQEAAGHSICRREVLGGIGSVGDHDRRRIAASKMASEYWAATLRSPKARVAYWHAIGRLFYPALPRFMSPHRLTPLHSNAVHDVFRQLEHTGTYVLAWAFANWTELNEQHQYQGPSLYSLTDYALDFVTRRWVEAFARFLERDASPRVEELGLRLHLL